MEAQRGHANFPRSHSYPVAKPRPKFRLWWSVRIPATPPKRWILQLPAGKNSTTCLWCPSLQADYVYPLQLNSGAATWLALPVECGWNGTFHLWFSCVSALPHKTGDVLGRGCSVSLGHRVRRIKSTGTADPRWTCHINREYTTEIWACLLPQHNWVDADKYMGFTTLNAGLPLTCRISGSQQH